MLTYYNELQNVFFNAVQDVKASSDVKVFAIQCMDAGNYDILMVVGDKKHQVYYRLTYEGIKVFRTKQDDLDEYFEDIRQWPEDSAREVFIYSWLTIHDYLQIMEFNVAIYQEGKIQEEMYEDDMYDDMDF